MRQHQEKTFNSKKKMRQHQEKLFNSKNKVGQQGAAPQRILMWGVPSRWVGMVHPTSVSSSTCFKMCILVGVNTRVDFY